MNPRRYREADGIIHSESAAGIDYTLCGAAFEEGRAGEELEEVARGRVDCPDCVRIIRFGKSFPSRLLKR